MARPSDGPAAAREPAAAGDPALGQDDCPCTAGYRAFLHRNRERLAGNARMRRPLRGLDRLADLPLVVQQGEDRGAAAP